ncbi:hypothetical protein L3X38_003073 [Prunus dulcis]|uniref:No apical meristem-associated C-terminal domain-containing protein n=1 Tax=Prunus dulcis TaxID=3755 RepID=A0AAD4ZKL1_PRUDU|nr:hypothetical protein L3X38_003073 [Prunus dulcis]
MLEAFEVFYEIQNYPHEFERCVERNTAPRFTSTESPLNSRVDVDSQIEREPRPIRRKAAKVKRESTSNNECAKFLEQIALQGTMRMEKDMKIDEADKARDETFSREMEYAHIKDIYKKDRETMVMVTNHISHETKTFWK